MLLGWAIAGCSSQLGHIVVGDEPNWWWHFPIDVSTLRTNLKHLLENIVWHALSGPQSKVAVGASDALRYAPGFSPIVGFANAQSPNFDTLAPYCKPDEHFYCDGWSGAARSGWRVDEETLGALKTLLCSTPGNG